MLSRVINEAKNSISCCVFVCAKTEELKTKVITDVYSLLVVYYMLWFCGLITSFTSQWENLAPVICHWLYEGVVWWTCFSVFLGVLPHTVYHTRYSDIIVGTFDTSGNISSELNRVSDQ